MSSNIIFSGSPSAQSPEMRRPRSTSHRRFRPAVLSDPTVAVRADMKRKTLCNIKNSGIRSFIEEIILSLDPIKHYFEIIHLKETIKTLLASNETCLKKTILREIDVNTMRLTSVNEKNPIIYALISLDLDVIDNLKLTIPTPEFLHDFFDNLKFYATVHQVTDILTLEEQSSIPIEKQLHIVNNLLKHEEISTALNILNLTQNLICLSERPAHKKIKFLQQVAALLLLAEQKTATLNVLKRAISFVQDISTIEQQIKALTELAIDFSSQKEKTEIIKIMNFITNTVYFSSNQKVRAFKLIFNCMLEEDPNLEDPNFMFKVIEETKNSLAKDKALIYLVSCLKEVIDTDKQLTQTVQLANCIQNKQLRAETLKGIPEDKKLTAEMEAV
jgi:hypothetical protein